LVVDTDGLFNVVFVCTEPGKQYHTVV